MCVNRNLKTLIITYMRTEVTSEDNVVTDEGCLDQDDKGKKSVMKRI